MEPRERPTRITAFEITGPEFMGPAVNFFDQPPFAQILSDVAKQDEDLVRQLRSGLRLGLIQAIKKVIV